MCNIFIPDVPQMQMFFCFSIYTSYILSACLYSFFQFSHYSLLLSLLLFVS